MEITINKSNFQSEVMNSDKPVLIDFWATWCPPCRMLAPIIEEIANEHNEIKVGKVNVDEESELAEQFDVENIPTVILIKGGKIVGKSVGYKPKADIEAMLK